MLSSCGIWRDEPLTWERHGNSTDRASRLVRLRNILTRDASRVAGLRLRRAAAHASPAVRRSARNSAGRPYLICIAFTAVRLCWPSTPSTLPTLKPARTSSCCNSRDLAERQLRDRRGRPAHRRRAGDAGGEIAGGGRIDQRVIPLGIGREIRHRRGTPARCGPSAAAARPADRRSAAAGRRDR